MLLCLSNVRWNEKGISRGGDAGAVTCGASCAEASGAASSNRRSNVFGGATSSYIATDQLSVEGKAAPDSCNGAAEALMYGIRSCLASRFEVEDSGWVCEDECSGAASALVACECGCVGDDCNGAAEASMYRICSDWRSS